jgi:polyhydroxybutyrate depolymerase
LRAWRDASRAYGHFRLFLRTAGIDGLKRPVFNGVMSCITGLGWAKINPLGFALVSLLLMVPLTGRAAALPQQPGEYELTLVHGGLERTYILHLPPQYDGHSPLPLVLAFHGGGGNARQLLESSDLGARADRDGFILVAPNGTGRFREHLLTWNVGFGFGYAMRHHIDDIGFVRQLLDTLESGLSIDRRRVFATGISNGGILCHFLAASLSSRIAAIAPIVGCVGGRKAENEPMIMPPRPASPVAVIAFNGALDKHIPYAGGRQLESVGRPVFVTSADTMHAFWERANHCEGPPDIEDHSADQYKVIAFSRGCRGAEVVQYLILDQGHAWPGGKKPRFFADAPSTHVSADDVMWAFFKAHPKPAD